MLFHIPLGIDRPNGELQLFGVFFSNSVLCYNFFPELQGRNIQNNVRHSFKMTIRMFMMLVESVQCHIL